MQNSILTFINFFCFFSEKYLSVLYTGWVDVSTRILSPERLIFEEHCLRAIVISGRIKVSVKHGKEFLPVHEDNEASVRKYAITVAVYRGKFQVMFEGDRFSAIAKIELLEGHCLDICKFVAMLLNF